MNADVASGTVATPNRQHRRPRPLTPTRPTLVRAHRWLSLVLGAWIGLMAVTGFVLVFRDQIDYWSRPELFARTPGDVGAQAAVDAAAAGEPEHVVEGLYLPAHYRGLYVVFMHLADDEERYLEVFVDPGSGRINGTQDSEAGFTNWVFRLHEALLAERILGVEAIDFVAWLGVAWLLTLVTGTLLWWWPRARRWKLGVRRHKGRFGFHFDTHRIVGVASLVPLLLVVVTGINFAFPDQVGRLWTLLTPATGLSVFEPDEVLLKSDPVGAGPPLDAGQARARLQSVIPDGELSYLELPPADDPETTYGAYISAPHDPYRGPPGYAGQIQANIDQYSGAVTYVGDPRENNLADELYDVWSFPIHAGTFGGFWTRVLWLAVAAAPAVMATTGLIMWMLRRRARRERVAARNLAPAPVASPSDADVLVHALLGQESPMDVTPAQPPEGDPRKPTVHVRQELDELIAHLRQDARKVRDARAEALFETAAEVLGGLRTAFADFEQRNESA